MASRRSLGSRIVQADLTTQQLLDQAVIVGGIYTMAYDTCLVLTNDLWKQEVGGVPQHCFLLATAMEPGQAPDQDDEEVILLRVQGPTPLPQEAELVAVRAEAMREIVTRQGVQAAARPAAVVDVLTRNEIQFSALKAKVLGTFYDDEVNGRPILAFGSDIETFYSASRYKVYKPYGRALEIIAGYPLVTPVEELRRQADGTAPARVRLGTVRYTSTRRRQQRDAETALSTVVPVMVNIEDFIAMKTAVFGMTRLGKSNTMKTIATAVFEYTQRTGLAIGQLLFDPAGEYANVNVQDRTALSAIGPNYVTVFRYGANENEANVRPLQLNLFAEQTIEVTWDMIRAWLSDRATVGYVQAFREADVLGPPQDEDRRAWERARRRRAALFATLAKAQLAMPRRFSVRFAANQGICAAVNAILSDQDILPVTGNRQGVIELDATNLLAWFEAANQPSVRAVDPDWFDPGLDAILNVMVGNGIRGFRDLMSLRSYHTPNRDDDYAEEVLNELLDGKIVIVDLSRGTESVLQNVSERIITFVVRDAANRFAQGEAARNIQIYIEEAHRLFNRERMQKLNEADPYVRLAKEAAKYRIGLIYATQEVSSVDPIILSNTSNWIVTHLNNQVEVKELSKYYDFEDYAELTLKAEDVGFVRLKTRSGRYIVPVQVDLFGPERVTSAREAAKRR